MSPRAFRLGELLGGFVLFFLVAAALMRMRRPGPAVPQLTALQSTAMLKPGAKVAELEAAMERAALPPGPAAAAAVQAALPGMDPAQQVRDRARELAQTDPQRAAHIVRAWINVDNEEGKRA